MLENAVHPIDSLRMVKTQSEQHKAHTRIELSYFQYTLLLLSAAQQHNKQPLGTPRLRLPCHKVYSYEIDYGEPYDISDC